MNIERIDTYVLTAPLSAEHRFYSSQAAFGERTSLVVRIRTDAGIEGWGESGVSMPVHHVASYIHDVLAPRVLGKDALATEPLWHDLYAFSRDFGRKATPIDALSGIDIALWDIRGKETGKPVHALMGGVFRKRIRAYATGLYYTDRDLRDPAGAPDRAAEEARRHVEAGFTAVKTKIGLLPLEHDIHRMAAVREAVGDGFLLMADANHAYNRALARRMGEALQRLDFFWFEEPLVPEDIEGYRELRGHLSIAIAAGECEYTRYGMLDLLRASAVDILQPDICASGGLSEAQKIVAIASAHNTPVMPHVWGTGVALATALQVAAIVPPTPHTAAPHAPENEPIFEYDRTPNPLRDDLVAGGFALQNQTLAVPDKPGLGIEIDEKVLDRFCTVHRTSDGR